MRFDFTNRGDGTHRTWAWRTTALFLTAALMYCVHWQFFRTKSAGGSIPGIIYGIVGYGLMCYAAFLSVRKRSPKLIYWVVLRIRKKFPGWRLPEFSNWHMAPVRTWMQRHVWLGLLSYPLIFFHSGFSFGTGLTRLLMWIFLVVVITGVAGAVIQHYMPQIMTQRVARESIYGEIGHLQQQLQKRASELMARLHESNDRYRLPPSQSGRMATHRTTTSLIRISPEAGQLLRQTYEQIISPYLGRHNVYRHKLRRDRSSKDLFANLRARMPDPLQPVVDGLESICDEKRDYDRQSALHLVLHGWLLAHVPLSLALIVLGLFHGLKALRYG